jgi:glycerol-3-phosphate dehydrogenase
LYSEFSDLEGRYASSPFGLLKVQRSDVIDQLKRSPRCDVLVVGGGIQGACFARLAAFNGLRTILLEQADYASATSSRSSKMAHGGLRYLELLDFGQVFEGIRCREELFATATHLVAPHPFLIPLFERGNFEWLKFRAGLKIYDFLVKAPTRCSHNASVEEMQADIFASSLQRPQRGLVYYDGIMRDTRLVLETLLSARQEGATALNYARVDSLQHQAGSTVSVGWTDVLSKTKHELQAGIVVNCCGPWVGDLGRISSSPMREQLCFSRGAHLLFSVPWNRPALFLPLAGRGRYYFVWPHPGGTMVGTTERVTTEIEVDPQARPDEIQEILDRLAQDIPAAGLDRSSLYYAFAGIRTLVANPTAKSSYDISRKPFWRYSSGVLSLLGGKYTTALSSAFEGLKKVYELSGISRPVVALQGRRLPGAAHLDEARAAFFNRCQEMKVDPVTAQQIFGRYGALTKFFLPHEDLFELVGPGTIRGEIDFAIEVEQSETLEDLMRRRLELELLPGAGFANMGAIFALLKSKRPNLDAQDEQRYRSRIEAIQQLCRAE